MGVCGEDAGPGGEGEGSVGAAVVAGGAAKGGAYEKGWIDQCLAQRGKSAVQRWSAAVCDGSGVADGGTGAVSVAVPVVCDAHCSLHFVPHYPLHACLPHQC